MFVVSPLLISRGYVGVIYSFVGLKYFIIKESGSVGNRRARIPARQQLAGAESLLPPSDAAQTFRLITVLGHLLSPAVPLAQPISPVFSGI